MAGSSCLFPVLVFSLIRLNREYRAEAAHSRDVPHRPARFGEVCGGTGCLCFVNSVGPRGGSKRCRYGKRAACRRDDRGALHGRRGTGRADTKALGSLRHSTTRLRVVDCPDRRIIRAAPIVCRQGRATNIGTPMSTVLLPRRTYNPLMSRLLHDRTADKIARAVSLIPDCRGDDRSLRRPNTNRGGIPGTLRATSRGREFEKFGETGCPGRGPGSRSLRTPLTPSRSVITVAGPDPGAIAPPSRDASTKSRTSPGASAPYGSIIVGDHSGRDRHYVPARPRRRRHPGPVSCCGSSARPKQTGNRPLSMLDPAYHIVEDPGQGRKAGKVGGSQRLDSVTDGGARKCRDTARRSDGKGRRRQCSSGLVAAFGGRVESGVHRQWLPAVVQGWIRLGVRIRLRRVRVGTSGAKASASSSPRWRRCRARLPPTACAGSAGCCRWCPGWGCSACVSWGNRANEPLTAAPGCRAWVPNADGNRVTCGSVPAPGGATAKKPGAARMFAGLPRLTPHDGDISYGEFRVEEPPRHLAAGPDLDRNGRAPVLLQIPGGAWMVGNKTRGRRIR